MDAVRDRPDLGGHLAQLLESRFHIDMGVGHGRQPECYAARNEALLRAVVQVAFDPCALRIPQRDELTARVAQHVQVISGRRRQALVVEGERPRRSEHRRHDGRIGVHRCAE